MGGKIEINEEEDLMSKNINIHEENVENDEKNVNTENFVVVVLKIERRK